MFEERYMLKVITPCGDSPVRRNAARSSRVKPWAVRTDGVIYDTWELYNFNTDISRSVDVAPCAKRAADRAPGRKA